MHLSFCLLLFASLFGATVQTCCKWPVYRDIQNIPKQYAMDAVPREKNWNGCDQSLTLRCAGSSGEAPQVFIVGNYSTRPILQSLDYVIASQWDFPLKCDTNTGLWKVPFGNRQNLVYKEFVCVWTTMDHKTLVFPKFFNGV
ncbi:hypothetical protein CRE_24985 [Caenorhabditis remanei]|uniref:Uncharacterized protein n=1 Tax=Caenorhabditis remanei TaxID=31234 RepID=E3MHR8_CAERE|nr:hypothetical protein CRE_24985 [Caenorhabditis remanei]